MSSANPLTPWNQYACEPCAKNFPSCTNKINTFVNPINRHGACSLLFDSMTNTEKNFDATQLGYGLFKCLNVAKIICNRNQVFCPEKKSYFYATVLQLTLVGFINLKIKPLINLKSTCAISFNSTHSKCLDNRCWTHVKTMQICSYFCICSKIKPDLLQYS